MSSNFVLAVAALVLGTATAQSPGLVLFQPIGVDQTLLIDRQGIKVHSWPGLFSLSAHVAPDGSLLRSGQTGLVDIGGATGLLQRLAFDGTLLWEMSIDGPFQYMHHDIEPMPNGNVLVIAWDGYGRSDAIARGRDPATVAVDWWPDAILEIQQTGATTGTVVWEWHLVDHLVQDFDASKANYGVVADNPHLVDINFPPVQLTNGDWNHFNGLDYDPVNDWIIVSSREQNEIYLIDHSTTTAEAAGHSGGQRGQGGDILWRWGNAVAYDAVGDYDQQLFGQHDPRFIPPGYPGAGHVTLFNNDYQPQQSAVFELELPLDPSGNIVLGPTGRYGPASPLWIFTEPSFYSRFVSSAERLPNGNTLICSGVQKRLLEVGPAGNTVWSHTHPAYQAVFQSHFVQRSMWADTEQLSAGGGEVAFDHVNGSGHAGQLYLLLGSMSGTSPGTLLPGGITLPLNIDALSLLMASLSNTEVFVDTMGFLDEYGHGASRIVAPPGFISTGLIGMQMDFAHLVFATDDPLLAVRVSNTTRVTIAP